MSYVLVVLKYLAGVLACFFHIVCPNFVIFEKLTPKNSDIKSFFLFREAFKTHLNMYE